MVRLKALQRLKNPATAHKRYNMPSFSRYVGQQLVQRSQSSDKDTWRTQQLLGFLGIPVNNWQRSQSPFKKTKDHEPIEKGIVT
jgi:hypothetical protein